MPERLDQLEKMLTEDPTDAFCLYGLAMEYAKIGRDDEALSMFDRTTNADPDQCYAYYHKARLLDDMGRTDDALATAKLGLERARNAGDDHAASELAALLDEFS